MKKSNDLFEKLAKYEIVNQNRINGGWYKTSGGSLDQFDGSESREDVLKTGLNNDSWCTTFDNDTRADSHCYSDNN